jgi:tRNA A37 threonylcarbamoyladenosine dehydratase
LSPLEKQIDFWLSFFGHAQQRFSYILFFNHVFLVGFMITVIGAGKVGSAATFDILRYKIGDVVLIDTNEKAAQGEVLDMI